jgi:hypothetical protein
MDMAETLGWNGDRFDPQRLLLGEFGPGARLGIVTPGCVDCGHPAPGHS